MYRQIVVHKDDQDFQRIIFRKSPNSRLHDYKLKTVTFGVSCVPYLQVAIRTLHELVENTKSEFPLATQVLKTQTYVDDILSQIHSLPQAYESLLQVAQSQP